MQTHTATDTRHRWVDLIRALGAFLVVLAHVHYQGAGARIIGDFYYAVTRAAVPLFFMASGYLLLGKTESYADFFRKRAVKVFMPFFVWSLIYLLWQQEGFGAPLWEIVKSYLLKILRGPRENHLWFFYELFALYLFAPILRVYLQKAQRADLYYFCGAWLLFIPILKTVQEFTPIEVGFSYYFLGGYIGYFLFGYLVGTLELDTNRKHIAWIFFLEGLLVTVAGKNLGAPSQYFEDYLSLNVVIMAGALFVALFGQSVSDSAYKWILPLSRASFGIYLAHVIVMAQIFALPPFSLLPQIGSNSYMTPLLGLLGFCLTFGLIFILQKIPILKNLVP